MATNGTNGKKKPAKRAKKRSTPKATPTQQRARREYLRRAGHKFSQEEIDAIRSQWAD
jgi:hypothetical protein